MTPPNIEKCDKALKELYKFSTDVIFLGEPIDVDQLKKLEAQIGYTLPLDFSYILKKHNSISVLGTTVYGFHQSFGEASIDKIYHFKHEAVENPMFPELLPFSPDGGGNHYCFDLSNMQHGLCPVVFWQHDFIYKDKKEVEVCNANFADWVQEVMIDWVLEHTNYDGSPKV